MSDAAGPVLSGQASGAATTDSEQAWPVPESRLLYDGHYLSLREDEIVAPDGERLRRQVVEHPGAVAVLAVDDHDRLLLVEQYRHAVGHRLLELPAGVLDVAGESTLDAARRELAEETDLRAATWEVLLPRLHASPGYTAERWEVFAARGLSLVPESERTARHAEEADMTTVWMPFAEAVEAVLAGRIGDAMTAAGVLAERARRAERSAS